MSTIHEAATLLGQSLRTRRDLLGKSHPNASRDALRSFVAATKDAGSGDFAGKAAAVMFVGEASGGEQPGEPFAGPAGELLAKIIRAMGLAPGDVSIVTIPKSSAAREMQSFLPRLRDRIARVPPRVLVALGEIAMLGLADVSESMEAMRGRWFSLDGIPLLPTFPPSHLLRNDAIAEKRKIWEDMLLVMEKLDLPISEKQRGYFRSNA